MKLIPTFCNGCFRGYNSFREVNSVLYSAHELARKKQESEKADHMIYGYFSYDKNGNITEARVYDGVAKTDEEFEKIALLEKAHIYAIHNHR